MKSPMAAMNPTDTLIKNPAGDAFSTGPDDAAPKRIACYDLRREIGRGALSVVYEAEDTRTGQDVALKLLTLPPSLNPEEAEPLIAGFEREALTTARFSHPNIVQVHEASPQQNRHFLVMEYLQGQTLQKRMSEGALTPAEAFPILTQIAGALDAVHKAGMIHRDVKPANIMLLPDGTAKLLDFGIAQSTEEARMTHRGAVAGSPSYMAPEQIKGEPETTATDTWALGVLSYEMLTGHLPFTGLNVGGVMFQIMHQLPTPMPDLPPAIQEVLLRALDKRPSQRYSTAGALVRALKLAHPRQAPATSEQKPAAPQKPAASQEPAASSPLSIPKWLPGSALLFLFLLGFCGAVLVRRQASNHVQKEAVSPNPAQLTGQSPVPTSVPPHVLQASQPQVSQPQAVQPDVSPVPYLAPVPLKTQAAPRSHPAALLNAPTLLKLRKSPVTQVKQAAAEATPVHEAQTMAAVPVQPRRPSVNIKPVNIKPVNREQAANRYAANRHVPMPTSSQHVAAPTANHPTSAQVASQHLQLPTVSQQAPVQRTGRSEPVQSTEQTFSLPAGGDSYDPEADARLRKSAWSQNGPVSHP